MINAQLVLSPLIGKRLIAKAVLKSEHFRKAIEKGIVVLSLGTTNALIYEEITGKKVSKEAYAAGIVKDTLTLSDKIKRLPVLVLNKGEAIDISWQEALIKMGEDSLFIKGANAYDDLGLVGVLVGGEAGGTIGQALGTLVVKKIPLMVPIGLEKRVPSVRESAILLSEPATSTQNLDVGMVVVANGIIIDEIKAFKILFDLDATLVAAGGIAGFEGSYVINIKGTETIVNEALDLVNLLKD